MNSKVDKVGFYDRVPGPVNTNTGQKTGIPQTIDQIDSPQEELLRFTNQAVDANTDRPITPKSVCGWISPSDPSTVFGPNIDLGYVGPGLNIRSFFDQTSSQQMFPIPYTPDGCLIAGLPGSPEYTKCISNREDATTEGSGIDWIGLAAAADAAAAEAAAEATELGACGSYTIGKEYKRPRGSCGIDTAPDKWIQISDGSSYWIFLGDPPGKMTSWDEDNIGWYKWRIEWKITHEGKVYEGQRTVHTKPHDPR